MAFKSGDLLWCWLYWLLAGCVVARWDESRLFTREDLKTSVEVFSQSDAGYFSQLLFDIERYQLIVGARDHLFRLSLEGLKKLEEADWPADSQNVTTCRLKGKSENDCRNYVKVLVSNGTKLFACGTNAFAPECSWRNMDSLKSVLKYEKGEAKCPYNPYANNTAVMTSEGDYYIASTIDFSGRDFVIYKIMGTQPFLRTVRFDPKWLSEASFVASYEIDNFVYFFFREAAVEYINCGKAIYSRVARICKNDQGGAFQMTNKFTTFLKARLNCSVQGSYPFYFNEIQSVHFIEREEIFYATFNTPINSIYGTAICAYNMSSIITSFTGAFKHQENPKSSWERQTTSHKHFQCEKNDATDASHFLDSEKFQLMNDAVQPMTSYPIVQMENERFSHIAVDTVQTKDSEVHVLFVASVENVIHKFVVLPNSKHTCLIEKVEILPKDSSDSIKVLKFLRDTNSLYIGTEESVIRIPVHRCDQFYTKNECLSAMDPYCGWNSYKMACTAAPNRNPKNVYWLQEPTACPRSDLPVDGGWATWGHWSECTQVGLGSLGQGCQCQQRSCTRPAPANGGKNCQGTLINVANCTRDGGWTEWSSWSSCSQSCGLAVKSRRRVCGNPTPAFGGKGCVGPERDEIYCTQNPLCPVANGPSIDGHWSGWSTWEECNVPCGGGFQIRRRRCNSPPPHNGGRDCTGCPQDYRMCNTQICPEFRKSTSWTPFYRVNQTKDGHFEQRLRFQCRANVPDESLLRVGQMRKEERFCREGSPFCGLQTGSSSGEDGWSEWSSWSHCSVSCGGGVQSRERTCDSPRMIGGGLSCVGPIRDDRPCNIESCQELESWELWSSWSPCDVNLEQTRARRCLLPPSQCEGSTREVRICIPEQIGLAETKSAGFGDSIHAGHVAGAFISGLVLGTLISALLIYFYLKKRYGSGTQGSIRVATQLIPLNSNTYVDGANWKNNFSTQKSSLREATIKRNGSIRAQLQSDNF